MNIVALTKKCQSLIQDHTNILTIDHDTLNTHYNQLIQCLTEHNHRYHIQAAPIISDYEYDQLFSYLKKIEEYYPNLISQDSPTQSLVEQSSDTREWFSKAKHKTKLLSLQNSYNENGLKDFDKTVQKILSKSVKTQEDIEYYCEPKFDWISVELIYKNRKLTQAITRWDGYMGDDITNNVKQIQNIPHTLTKWGINMSDELRFRAEIVMPKSQRQKMNKEKAKAGENLFANTRNAAAGTIKLLDSQEVKKRNLICYVYEIMNHEQKIKTQEQAYNIMKELWLPVFWRGQKKWNIEQVTKLCLQESTYKELEKFDIDFDGIVIKVNNIEQREQIWQTDHHPRRAIAYKFPAQQATTQIQSVEWQVGRTWTLTPVAHLNPIKLSGVTISRASLHNHDYIINKDIRTKDRVRIQRSGEVIPYIIAAIKEKRNTDQQTKPIVVPSTCPSCKAKIQKKEAQYYCPNFKNCGTQIKEQLIHFCSKQCMQIEWLGEKLISTLVEQNIIKNVTDLYKLQDRERYRIVQRLPWFGHKRIEDLISQIEWSKKQELWRLIHGLGLPGMGKKMSKELQKAIQRKIKDDKEQYNATKFIKDLQDNNFLNQIPWVADTTIKNLGDRSKDPFNQRVLLELEKHWLEFNVQEAGEKQGRLSWLHFSITGSLNIPREEIIKNLEKNGATYDSEPTNKTDFIFIGEKAGSKRTKAEKYKLKTYNSIQDFQNNYPEVLILNRKNDTQNKKPESQSLF